MFEIACALNVLEYLSKKQAGGTDNSMTEQVSAESISDILLSEAKKQGAEAADVLVATGVSTSVDVRMGRLELSERAEGIDVGLRIFIGQKQAIVSGSDAKMTSLSAMVERAVAMAKFAPDDPFCGLADPSQFAKEWDVEALDLKDPSAEPDAAELQEAALAVEASAMSKTQVEQVSDAAASYTKNKVYLQTSNGFTGSYERTSHGISCVAIAGTGLGMERDYDYDGRCHRSDMRSPHKIGALAAQRAVERLNPVNLQLDLIPCYLMNALPPVSLVIFCLRLTDPRWRVVSLGCGMTWENRCSLMGCP